MRFYDLSVGNDLDDSGERYCHSTGPDFSYNSEIQVLFRSNLDPVVSTGFDCEVVASPITTIPPPRVSSFAQEACTDVTVSGRFNDKILLPISEHKTHTFTSNHILKSASFDRCYKHDSSSACSRGGSAVHFTRLRRHLRICGRVEVSLDLCACSWSHLVLFLLSLQHNLHGSCWRAVCW